VKIDLEPPDLTKVSRVILKRIKERIASSGKWNNTGHLVRSLKAMEDGVLVAGDRLERPELADKFFAEIIPHDIDEETRKALRKAALEALKIER